MPVSIADPIVDDDLLFDADSDPDNAEEWNLSDDPEDETFLNTSELPERVPQGDFALQGDDDDEAIDSTLSLDPLSEAVLSALVDSAESSDGSTSDEDTDVASDTSPGDQAALDDDLEGDAEPEISANEGSEAVPPGCQCVIRREFGGKLQRCDATANTTERMRSVALLKHARFEIDFAEASQAVAKHRAGDLFVCHPCYMLSQNVGKRCRNSTSLSDDSFKGLSTVVKRRCRVCRSYSYLAGSRRAAKYRTQGGIVFDAAYRGARPAPLVEIASSLQHEEGRAPFVCAQCLGGLCSTTTAPPSTAALDAAFERAREEETARRRGGKRAGTDQLLEEAKEKGAWLAKYARRSRAADSVCRQPAKRPWYSLSCCCLLSQGAHPMDISWAHRVLTAFVEGFVQAATKASEASRLYRSEQRRLAGAQRRPRHDMTAVLKVFLINFLAVFCKRRLNPPFLRALTLLSALPAKSRKFRQLLAKLRVIAHSVRTHQLHRRAAAATKQCVFFTIVEQ